MTKRGIALISVLWISVLLSLVAASFTRTSRTEINLTRNKVENAQAAALADAAINRAVLGLFLRPTQGGFRVDGTVYFWQFGGANILFQIHDEGGKVDLNGASFDLLRKLLRAVGAGPKVSREVAASILDFRDFDDESERGGAEDRDYRQANVVQSAKDAPFELIEELQQVLGMPPKLYPKMAPLITVYTGQGTPFSQVADPIIQEIMRNDLDPGEEAPVEPEIDGDESEEGSVSLPPVADGPQPLSEEGTDARSRVNVFTIHAEARMEGGSTVARKAVIRVSGRRGRGYKAFTWQSAPVTLFPQLDAVEGGFDFDQASN